MRKAEKNKTKKNRKTEKNRREKQKTCIRKNYPSDPTVANVP